MSQKSSVLPNIRVMNFFFDNLERTCLIPEICLRADFNIQILLSWFSDYVRT